MFFQYGIGDLTLNEITEAENPKRLSLAAVIKWAMDARVIEVSTSGGRTASIAYPFSLGTASMSDSAPASAVYSAQFQHLDTGVWTEVTNPHAWYYLTHEPAYVGRCGYRIVSESPGAHIEQNGAYLAGAFSFGCPSISDFTVLSTVSTTDVTPSLDIDPLTFYSYGAYLENTSVVSRDPKTGLYYAGGLPGTNGVCEQTETTPERLSPGDPGFVGYVERSIFFNKSGPNVITFSDSRITNRNAASGSKQIIQSSTYDEGTGIWGDWSDSESDINANTGGTKTHDRTGFSGWAWTSSSPQTLINDLSTLGITL